MLTDLEGITRLDATDEKPVHLDNIRCRGGSSLADCCRSGWGKTSCDHSLDAYVACDLSMYQLGRF